MSRPVFLRPIYWSSASTVLVYDSNNITIDTGVYGSLLTLLSEIQTKIRVVDEHFTITFRAADYKIIWYSLTEKTTTWSSSTLRDLLGFTGTLTGGTTYTATHTPSHLWLPDHAPATQDEFRYRHRERFRGRTSSDGTIAGVHVDGGDLVFREFRFEFERAENVLSVMAASEYDRQRSLDTFLDGVRFSTANSTTQPRTTGCYFYPDYTDAQVLAASADAAAGKDLHFAASRDTHVFCHLVPGSIETPQPALPTTRDRWHVGFELNTSTPPTWTAGE
jgi:hypothetical protein